MARAPSASLEADPLWYKDAIIYQLHVKAFKDSDGDGTGDFPGLSEKLDYIADLGVNTVWLLPFYPSPMRDDGYDIADYRGIHPPYGTRSDLRQFIRQAHARKIRVITELVINHTSDQHPWFRAARRAPHGSARRNYYVWSDNDKKYAGTRIIFTDTETSNWAWDPVAQQYYWHRFFSHQPDLNFENPGVIKALIRIMRSWLDMGVDGFRLDAIPYLCEREGTSNENLPETHAAIKKMRQVIDQHYGNRLFLAEANQWPEDVLEYFGEGDECHMAYHFPLMPRMYMSMAQEDRHPIVEILEQTPTIPESCQWAIFLRNHDELTLEMVTDEERDYMYEIYARDPRARINVGIRRRLAPLMDNDGDSIKLLTSVLLSMPGSPILYYGDEIGMGDNIFLGDRNGMRTPMQWSPDRNAGFSRADPQQLYLPPIMDPVYGYQAVNVEAQSRDMSSLLNWTRRLIAVRKDTRAFGRGTLTLLAPGNRHILAYLREFENETVLCVANLSRRAQPVELDLTRFKGRVPVDMIGRSAFPPIGELPYLLTLGGRGFFWFRLATEAKIPEWHVEALPRSNLSTLIFTDGWDSFFPEKLPRERRSVAATSTTRLVRVVLPSFLLSRRWFAAKSVALDRVELQQGLIWQPETTSYLLLRMRSFSIDGSTQEYSLPLAVEWGSDQLPEIREQLPHALARVRDRARVGVLYEAFRDPPFCRAVIAAMVIGGEQVAEGSRLRFTAASAAHEICAELAPDAEQRVLPAETSNTVVIVGQQIFLKFYRRLESGPSHELEMVRFLTDHTEFRHFPRLVGAIEQIDGDESVPLAAAQEYRRSQGNAWSYFTHYVERLLEHARLQPDSDPAGAAGNVVQGEDEVLLETLGRRTGELHLALATPTRDPAFAAAPVRTGDIDVWIEAVQREAEHTLAKLAAILPQIDAASLQPATALRDRWRELRERIEACRPRGFCGIKIRYHGDYHLAQVLIAENDFVITDFEGEPARSMNERRSKHSPLRDVAGMLRSLDYAARTAAETVAQVPLGDPETVLRLAQRWRERAEYAFVRGYTAVTAGHGLHGDDEHAERSLIELFMIEKALYELRYEMDNRPSWVKLPAQGLLALLDGSSREAPRAE